METQTLLPYVSVGIEEEIKTPKKSTKRGRGRCMKRRELLMKVIRGCGIELVDTASFGMRLSPEDIEAILEFMRVLKVPATEEAVRNFLAAYLRLANGVPASDVDTRVASSSKGRRLWEGRLKPLM